MKWQRSQKRRRKNPNNMAVSEVAESTGFSHNAVLYWIRQGQLKATFDGYQYQVKPKELQRFLEHHYTDK